MCALILSHHILEWKARRQLPRGKRYHVHAAICKGIANQTTNAAAITVQLLRGAFLSVLVDRSVKQAAVTQAATGQSSKRQKSSAKDSTAAQAEALKQEMERRRIRECCVVAIFTDMMFEPGSGAAGERMRAALHEGTPTFVVVEAAYCDTVKRYASACFSVL